MKNKIVLVLVLCFAFIIGGAVASWLAGFTEAKIAGFTEAKIAGFTEAKIAGFAVLMLGVGAMVAKLWKERDPKAKRWLTVLALLLAGLGAFVAGLTGLVSEAQVSAVIGYVFALILIVAGIITSVVANKSKKLE